MWQANRSRVGVLYIAIGLNRVECGVKVGQTWLLETLRSFDISIGGDRAENLTCAAEALRALQMEAGNLGGIPAQSGTTRALRIDTIQVLLADPWVAMSTIAWHRDLNSRETAERFARAQMAQMGLDVAVQDTVKIDEAPFAQPRLAVAYPYVLQAELGMLADKLRARISCVLPMSLAAWKCVNPGSFAGETSDGVLGIVDEGWTALVVGRRHVASVVYRSFPSRESAGEVFLSDQWQRAKLRAAYLEGRYKLPVWSSGAGTQMSGEASAELQVVFSATAGDAVPGRLQLVADADCREAVNAMPLSLSGPAWAWGALTLVLLLVGLLAGDIWRTNKKISSTRAALVTLAAPAPPPRVVLSREESARVQSVNAAVNSLNLPVMLLLRALRPPQDIPVTILSVDLTGAATSQSRDMPLVRVTGEAKSGAEMARYTAFAGEQKPFVAAQLVRHEVIEALPTPVYRFTLEALWRE